MIQRLKKRSDKTIEFRRILSKKIKKVEEIKLEYKKEIQKLQESYQSINENSQNWKAQIEEEFEQELEKLTKENEKLKKELKMVKNYNRDIQLKNLNLTAKVKGNVKAAKLKEKELEKNLYFRVAADNMKGYENMLWSEGDEKKVMKRKRKR